MYLCLGPTFQPEGEAGEGEQNAQAEEEEEAEEARWCFID